ncbi:hypothetical protein Hanom_Chr13g01237251 [Helianthus anomalus]
MKKTLQVEFIKQTLQFELMHVMAYFGMKFRPLFRHIKILFFGFLFFGYHTE